MADLDLALYNLTNMQSLDAYAGARDIIPSGSAFVPTIWNDTLFNQVMRWNGNLRLSDADATIVGNQWLDDFNRSSISPRTAIRGLKLALSLKSMNPGATTYLYTSAPDSTPAAPNNFHVTPIPAIEEFSDTGFSLRAQQVVKAPRAGITTQTIAITEASSSTTINIRGDNQERKRVSCCYLAAFLMRLLVKAPDNVVNALPTMKDRFESFYGASRTVSEFNITLQQASAYKAALLSHALISNTFTHAVANTHQNHLQNLDAKEGGVITFLSFLHFAYVGMHAYTIMLELRNFTKVTLDKLLTLFHADITAPALMEIHTIITTLERTSGNPERSVIFRYCTNWGPHYFYHTRSRQCPHLLYTLSIAWQALSMGHENSNLEDIVAVQKLSGPMKATLRSAGEAAGRILKQSMLGGLSTSAIYSYALAQIATGNNENENVVPQDDWPEL